MRPLIHPMSMRSPTQPMSMMLELRMLWIKRPGKTNVILSEVKVCLNCNRDIQLLWHNFEVHFVVHKRRHSSTRLGHYHFFSPILFRINKKIRAIKD